jgi:hypothetical protein
MKNLETFIEKKVVWQIVVIVIQLTIFNVFKYQHIFEKNYIWCGDKASLMYSRRLMLC